MIRKNNLYNYYVEDAGLSELLYLIDQAQNTLDAKELQGKVELKVYFEDVLEEIRKEIATIYQNKSELYKLVQGHIETLENLKGE